MKIFKFLIIGVGIFILALGTVRASSLDYPKSLEELKNLKAQFQEDLSTFNNSVRTTRAVADFIQKVNPFLLKINDVLTLYVNDLGTKVNEAQDLKSDYKEDAQKTIRLYSESLRIQKESLETPSNLNEIKYYLIEDQNFKDQLLFDSRRISAQIIIDKADNRSLKVKELFSRVEKKALDSKNQIKDSQDIDKLVTQTKEKITLSEKNLEAAKEVLDIMNSSENADAVHNEILNLAKELNKNLKVVLENSQKILNLLKES